MKPLLTFHKQHSVWKDYRNLLTVWGYKILAHITNDFVKQMMNYFLEQIVSSKELYQSKMFEWIGILAPVFIVILHISPYLFKM